MTVPEYQDGCDGCRISQDVYGTPGGIIRLPGDWVANQYGATQGYLGWLVLQPRSHRDEFADLRQSELMALGADLQNLEAGLKHYWRNVFPDDLIERTYFVYFFESPFDTPHPPPYHLHLHIIPRTRCIGAELRETEGASTIINAWQVYRTVSSKQVPQRYLRPETGSWEAAVHLITYLRGELERPS